MIEFLRHSWVIASKDLTIEIRSRERLLGMLTFTVLVAVVFSFSLDPTVATRPIAGAMIWVTILFAGMLGLGRSFTVEQQQDAIVGVLLAPIDRGALYFGKFLANLVLLLTTALAIYLIYALFFQLSLVQPAGGLLIVTFLSCVGFMALGTLFSAMAANTRMGDTLIPIILIPLLIPVVIFGAAATQRLIMGRPFDEVVGSIRMLAAFDIIFVVACTMIFGAVVEE
jgi:heme exporter protein B